MTDTAAIPTVALAGESERSAVLRDRHRDYYVALAEEGEREVRLKDQAAWRAAMDAEYDNFRLALEWALAREDVEAALRLAITMFDIWYCRGDSRPALEWVEKALVLAGDRPLPLRAKALIRLGDFDSARLSRRPLGESFAFAEQALAVARASGDERVVAEALLALARPMYADYVGGPVAARALMDESLEIARRLGDDLAIANAFRIRFWTVIPIEGADAWSRINDEALAWARKVGDIYGVAWKLYGSAWSPDDPLAEWHAHESLEIGRSLNDDDIVSCVFQLLAYRRKSAGDYRGALAILRECLDEYRRPGRRWPVAWVEGWMLNEMAEVEFEMCDLAGARRHAEESLELRRRDTSQDDSTALGILGRIAGIAGDYAHGRSLCERAVGLARESAYSPVILDQLCGLGYLAFCSGDVETARSALAEEAGAADEHTRGAREQLPLLLLGDLAMAEGDLTSARLFFEEALGKARAPMVIVTNAADVQVYLARLARAEGEPATAAALYGAALSSYRARGHMPFVALVLEDMAAFAAERQDFAQAARFYGAAERIREETGVGVPFHHRRHHDHGLALLRSGADAATIDAAWSEGRNTPLDNILDAALEDS